MPLSDQEIETYRRDGLVIPSDYRLSRGALERIGELYQALLRDNRDNPDFSPDFILGPHLDTSGSYGIKGDPAWLDFARDPELLDMIEQLIGPDLILWGVTIFGKPARVGKATPWHQDGDYYPIEPLETLTVWISLDGSTPEQGCMKYIPGSHRDHRIYSHHFEHRDDYTLAQVCALQFWRRLRENDESVMDDFVALCQRGGEAPFQELVRGAHLISPFQEGCLESVVNDVRSTLA